MVKALPGDGAPRRIVYGVRAPPHSRATRPRGHDHGYTLVRRKSQHVPAYGACRSSCSRADPGAKKIGQATPPRSSMVSDRASVAPPQLAQDRAGDEDVVQVEEQVQRRHHVIRLAAADDVGDEYGTARRSTRPLSAKAGTDTKMFVSDATISSTSPTQQELRGRRNPACSRWHTPQAQEHRRSKPADSATNALVSGSRCQHQPRRMLNAKPSYCAATPRSGAVSRDDETWSSIAPQHLQRRQATRGRLEQRDEIDICKGASYLLQHRHAEQPAQYVLRSTRLLSTAV